MPDGTLPFKLDGEVRTLHFPLTGNAGQALLHILSGREYPLLGVKGYAPDFIVDVGANVGGAALFFAAAYPTAAMHCFEPSPSNFAYLEKNVAGVPRIQAFNVGLDDTEREARLFLGQTQCLQHSIFPGGEVGEEFETIELKRASAVLQPLLEGRGILKVDTEGCEVPILHDLAPLLDRIDVVYTEYHSERDRREMDRVLGEGFKLWFSKAHLVHRGSVSYVSATLLERFPQLDAWAITG